MIYYDNINGVLSKQDSLRDIIKMKKPDIVALCETKLHKNSKFEIKGYNMIKSNLKAGKEGILVAVKEGTYNTIQMIYESEYRNIGTVEIKYPEDTVRVIIGHGPQEDAPVEEKEEFYNDLKTEAERCLAAGCRLIITGDFNAKLESGDQYVPKGNGKLLREVVDMYQLKILNHDPKTEGKWTRIQKRKNEEIKSVLDYVIVDTATKEKVKEMIIDESKLFTPYHVKKERNQKTIVFSDHCAITSTFSIPTGKVSSKQNVEKSKVWILTADGLTKFQEETGEDFDLGDLSLCANPYTEWAKGIDDTMHKCFTKRTVKTGEPKTEIRDNRAIKMRAILRKISKRGKIQREIVREYVAKLIQIETDKRSKQRVQRVRETVSQLTEDDILSSNAFWKLRKSILKNSRLQLNAVNKRGGGITTDGDEIKEEVSQEFVFRLRNREAAPEWKGYVDATNKVVEELLSNIDDNSPSFTMEELDHGLKKMKTGTSPDCFKMYMQTC